MTRRAVIKTGNSDRVAAYLPRNYEVIFATDTQTLIEGHDNAGWTLDGYVLPRLASGLIFGAEVKNFDEEV